MERSFRQVEPNPILMGGVTGAVQKRYERGVGFLCRSGYAADSWCAAIASLISHDLCWNLANFKIELTIAKTSII